MTDKIKWIPTMDDRVRALHAPRMEQQPMKYITYKTPGFIAWLKRLIRIGGYTTVVDIETHYINCRCATSDDRRMIPAPRHTGKLLSLDINERRFFIFSNPKTLIIDSSKWTGRKS